MHGASCEMQQHACAGYCLFLFFAGTCGCINLHQAEFAIQMLPACLQGLWVVNAVVRALDRFGPLTLQQLC